MNPAFWLKSLATATGLSLLSGCANVSTTQVGYDNTERHNWQAAAAKGDAEAQYRLGEAYCCDSGFYSSTTARWCQAAKQHHPKVIQRLQSQLGTAYSEYCQKL